MASNYVLERTRQTDRARELAFAGDFVRLSGQINYPNTPPPLSGSYPLIFVLHHAGGNTREDYEHYARIGLRAGFAVFRWDKRGTGRSGAGGRGSSTQDAVYAYETAIEQPNVDPNRTVIVAQGEGTRLLGGAFGLFARYQRPQGIILVGNMLDTESILALESRVMIVNGENDWNHWSTYARDAAQAHNDWYHYGANYYVARDADRALTIYNNNRAEYHTGALNSIRDWLKTV